MSNNPDKDTSITLMMRVQQDPADPQAWEDFVRRYQPMIRAWCSRWGAQDSDADDVEQEVLLKLLTAMKKYHHEAGSGFRCWLKAVTHNAWLDLVDSRHQNPENLAGGLNAIVDSHDALADLEQQMEHAFERELLELAMGRVKERVKPNTWESFRLTYDEHLTGAEAAEQLDMEVSHVFVAKHRVLKLIEEEVRRIKAMRA